MLEINGKEFELLKPSADQLEHEKECQLYFLHEGGTILCRCQNDDSIHFVMRWIDTIQTYAENGLILDEEFKSDKYDAVPGVVITSCGRIDVNNREWEGTFRNIFPVRLFGDKVIFSFRTYLAPWR